MKPWFPATDDVQVSGDDALIPANRLAKQQSGIVAAKMTKPC